MDGLFVYDTDIGKLGIREKDGKIVNIYFEDLIPTDEEYIETSLIRRTYLELDEYFKGVRREFDIPLGLSGTSFQVKVWEELMKIPSGKTSTYKDIAIKIGNPKASRAVGMANNKNKIPIIIPCHRVIGTNGKLTGYAGGLSVKEKLLELER